MTRKSSLLALKEAPASLTQTPTDVQSSTKTTAPSRAGKKAITGYFSPEMSFAMHTTARKHNMSLQDAMADAFNHWLRKMGESPVGK